MPGGLPLPGSPPGSGCGTGPREEATPVSRDGLPLTAPHRHPGPLGRWEGALGKDTRAWEGAAGLTRAW